MSNNRRPGTGLKPRGYQGLVKPAAVKAEVRVSTNEGQPEGVKETVLEAETEVQTPPNLETEIVQNLDGTEPETESGGENMVAEPTEEFVEMPEVPKEVYELQQKMQESMQEMSGISGALTSRTEELSEAIKAMEDAHLSIQRTLTPEEISIEVAKYRMGIDLGKGDDSTVHVVPVPVAPQQLNAKDAALQSDGSLRVTITIAEEYVEGVRSAAESAERTLEQWGTENFQFFLEGYFTPSQSR